MESSDTYSASSYSPSTRTWDRLPRCFRCNEAAQCKLRCTEHGGFWMCHSCAHRALCPLCQQQGELQSLNGSRTPSISSGAISANVGQSVHFRSIPSSMSSGSSAHEGLSMFALRSDFHSSLEAHAPDRYAALQACTSMAHAVMQRHAPESYAALRALASSNQSWDAASLAVVNAHVPECLAALGRHSPETYELLQAHLPALVTTLQQHAPTCHAAMHDVQPRSGTL